MRGLVQKLLFVRLEDSPQLATEKALTEPTGTEAALAPENPRTGAVRELLRLLVKAQKAQRLYDGKNAVSERLEQDLFDRLSDFVENQGEVLLVVQEFQLKCEEVLVYDSDDRNDSLAFLLYRDGIRRLSFHPGLESEEVHAFLSCLNRVAVLAASHTDQDDLVTLFWEQDFQAIRYFAIEELSSVEAYPRLEEQLASGQLDCEGASAAESVSLDLQQPVSAVPVEACRLDDTEIEALRLELASEEAMPFQQVVTELAIELTLLEEDGDQRDELIESLVAIADSLIADGALDELAGMEEHLDGLARMVFRDQERVTRMAKSFLDRLSEPDRIDAFLGKVDEHHAPKPEVLTAYLARLGPEASRTVLPWIGRLSSSAYRRALTTALLVSGENSVELIAEHLPLDVAGASPREQLEHRQYTREIIHALAQHPGERALPVLERLLGARDPGTRREGFVAISRYPETVVEELCLDRLHDPDPEIRATALDTIVRRGQRELGRRVLDQALGGDDLEEQTLNEKRRLFAAVAKLCGESVLESLTRRLSSQEDKWFTAKKDRELAEAVAHGIRMIGTERARAILRQCAESGARFVRAVCAKELGH